ncbi:neural cell adhesion molecule 1-like [Palaemon carinicauda]|uniref:neural cell adhesion molecule 1-like n=1 Tax=Palaemon carinicauda TaxID=392227 RepID=UPI0035B62983
MWLRIAYLIYWPQSSVQGVEGMITRLPCMVARSHLGDTPNLVLWYKDGARLPFYTLDLREGVDKQELIDPKLKERIRTEYTGSHLVLDRALGSDSGRYRCRIDFNNFPTLSAIVTLTIYVYPMRMVCPQVRGGFLRSLTEGDPLMLYRIATGGRPPPQVSWWKINQLLSNRSIIAGEDGTCLASEEEGDEFFVGMGMEVGIRHVRAMLSIPALTRDYARTNISCKATNNNITEPLSTTLYLEVYTRTKEGQAMDADDSADRDIGSLAQMDGEAVATKGNKFVGDSNPSLAFTSQEHYHSGHPNIDGMLVSIVKTQTMTCHGPQTVTVVEGEDVRLTCKVDANPKDGVRFTWYFNNTLDTVEVERHRVQVKSGYSYLDYTPRSSRDYGMLACWATNTIGTQADPCQFTVVEAGPPESVTDCDLVNHTGGSLEVLCSPGEDGGLTQWFEGRVYSSPSYKLLFMLEESTPKFHVGGLTPGSDYIIAITSQDRKGSSQPVEIDAVKLKKDYRKENIQ